MPALLDTRKRYQVAKAKAGKKAEAEKFSGDAYCVKCKTKREFEGEVQETAAGRRMAKGPCPECGTTMCRILGKKK